MILKVNLEAVNQGNHGAPGTLLTREYSNGDNIARLPKENDRLLIQWGQDKAQSGLYEVKSIGYEFWADGDVMTFYVEWLG